MKSITERPVGHFKRVGENYYVYVIYHHDQCLFVGKIKSNNVGNILYKHFHKGYNGVKYIDVLQVTHIIYSRYNYESNMLVYYAYWLNYFKPILIKGYGKDKLTVVMPPVRWLKCAESRLEEWKNNRRKELEQQNKTVTL